MKRIAMGAVWAPAILLPMRIALGGGTGPATVAAFNDAFANAIRAMDNTAVLALWDEDGTSLLPATAPMRGKGELRAFLERVTAEHPGGRILTLRMECFEPRISGDWASEWCTEHQVLAEPGKSTPFDGWGNLLLVLHRTGGVWRLHTEMWNEAVPGPTAPR